MTVDEAIAAIDRRTFLPESFANMHGVDAVAVPFADGQTVPTALITEFMLKLAEVKPDQIIMEVGTGSGYQCAILSLIAKEVHSLEVKPVPQYVVDLLPRRNVYLYNADAARHVPLGIEFDSIVVTCSVPFDGVPLAWERILKERGVVVMPHEPTGEIRKYRKELFTMKDLGPFAYANFVPMVTGDLKEMAMALGE